jgi:hypothetical protein
MMSSSRCLTSKLRLAARVLINVLSRLHRRHASPSVIKTFPTGICFLLVGSYFRELEIYVNTVLLWPSFLKTRPIGQLLRATIRCPSTTPLPWRLFDKRLSKRRRTFKNALYGSIGLLSVPRVIDLFPPSLSTPQRRVATALWRLTPLLLVFRVRSIAAEHSALFQPGCRDS